MCLFHVNDDSARRWVQIGEITGRFVLRIYGNYFVDLLTDHSNMRWYYAERKLHSFN